MYSHHSRYYFIVFFFSYILPNILASILSSSSLSPSINQIDSNDYATIKSDIGPPHLIKRPTKPPLAGPYAFSRIPKPFRYRPKVFLMHDIQNTWLFDNLKSSG